MARLKAEYKGYFIESCDDGTFDIVEANGELVDGEYPSVEAAELFIDEITEN